MAWQLQNIGKPSRIITALKSTAQQAGKGCLLSDILAVIYGNAGFVTSEIGQIITRFNDTIRGKAYVFLDEALFSGDRKAADAVKSLATNHDDAAHIEESDARYWILEVSPHKVGNSAYFKDLYEEIENGGREAFMDYLLSIDVSTFLPSRDAKGKPKAIATEEQMNMVIHLIESLQPSDAIEAALASQFAITYIRGLEEATNEYSKNLSMVELFEFGHKVLETLNRYRTKGAQMISVNYNHNQGQINNIKVFEKDNVSDLIEVNQNE